MAKNVKELFHTAAAKHYTRKMDKMASKTASKPLGSKEREKRMDKFYKVMEKNEYHHDSARLAGGREPIFNERRKK